MGSFGGFGGWGNGQLTIDNGRVVTLLLRLPPLPCPLVPLSSPSPTYRTIAFFNSKAPKVRVLTAKAMAKSPAERALVPKKPWRNGT